jgi:hypothetical protein
MFVGPYSSQNFVLGNKGLSLPFPSLESGRREGEANRIWEKGRVGGEGLPEKSPIESSGKTLVP